MKLAFVYPAMLVGGRPLDFDAIDTSPRGTTGSETMILSMAREMAARGHDVTLHIAQAQPERLWGAIRVRSLESLRESALQADLERVSMGFDATCVSLDCNAFLPENSVGMPGLPGKRVVFQQVNDFNYAARPDFASFVDLFVSPSRKHKEHMEEVAPTTKGKWGVLPNGCRIDDFAALQDPHSPPERVRGRIIYASSPDRGLHLLLQEWPAIKRAVPHAHLKIFYYSLASWVDQYSPHFAAEPPDWLPFWKENRRRAKYVVEALEALKPHGVELVGAVSRRTMAAEMMAAEVLAYPCDTIAYTEGFSCATLEGCASGALPVISAMDALGDIYRGAVPMSGAPARKHLSTWTPLVIRALTDKPWADEWRGRARKFAEKHDWSLLAEKFEGMLKARIGRNES